MFHNILVAIDGSADAEQALTEAIDLAESENARLTLITAASQVPSTAYVATGVPVAQLVQDAQVEAEAILRRARERVPDGISVRWVLSEQPIREALIRQIATGHYDLVVTGSRGRGAVRSALLGSVSQYVAAPQPHPGARRPRRASAEGSSSSACRGRPSTTASPVTADTATPGGGGLLSQPRAVWAVAFAAVVSFMGLGLVDPILPAIAKNLDASPSQVELLFTSYFAFTGISMLVSSFVASRIGAKRTLLAGLVLIIAFSAAAGASNTIGAIVGLRAGWGLGNALFIATALSVIVGSASGGVAGAVVLYEAALGLGHLVRAAARRRARRDQLARPVLRRRGADDASRSSRSSCSWSAHRRRPRASESSIAEPLLALRHRATRGSGLTAVFYNFGFFTLLAYTPFALHLSIHQLGYTFTGWGCCSRSSPSSLRRGSAAASAMSAGSAERWRRSLAILVVMGVLHASQTALIVCVIALRRVSRDHEHADDAGRDGVCAGPAADRLLGLQLRSLLRRRDRPIRRRQARRARQRPGAVLPRRRDDGDRHRRAVDVP